MAATDWSSPSARNDEGFRRRWYRSNSATRSPTLRSTSSAGARTVPSAWRATSSRGARSCSERATVLSSSRSARDSRFSGTPSASRATTTYGGLELVDVETRGVHGVPSANSLTRVGDRLLVGFENHGGRTTLGTAVSPFGDVVRGRGNDGALDGFRDGNVWATYAHGPVLALNPWLADQILASVLGRELDPVRSVADRLYDERCAALTPRSRDVPRRLRRR